MSKNIFFILNLVLLLTVSLVALAANEFVLNEDVNFSLLTIDTATSTIIVGLNGGAIVGFTIETNFLDLTMESGSSITFDSNSNFTFTITKQSGSDSFIVTESCRTGPTSRVDLSATDNVVLRVQVSSTQVCVDVSGVGAPGGGGPSPPAPPLPPPLPPPDFNFDAKVDLVDFATLVSWWKSEDPDSPADLNKDRIVDLFDFAILVFYWTG